MNNPVLSVALFCLLGLSGWQVEAGNKLTLSQKALLQAAMQSYIDQSSVDGHFLILEPKTGHVGRLTQKSPHPIILRADEFFILCSDFESAKGKAINIDFYLTPKGENYVVFAQLVQNRSLVKQLMNSGRAKRVD